MKKLIWIIFCASVFSPGFLFSGPRWWWDDVPVALTPKASVSPDITLPVSSGTKSDAIFVVWEEVPAGETDDEILLSASFDKGCSFCDPIQVTHNDLIDANPSVAAGVLGAPNPGIMIHIAHLSGANVEVSYNTAPLNVNQLSCAALSQVTWATKIVNKQGLVGVPDIAAAAVGQNVHFHVVYDFRNPSGGGMEDIYHVADLIGDGSYGPADDVTNTMNEQDLVPAVSADNSPGTQTPPASAVNVVYLAGSGVNRRVLYRRSVDSGASLPTATAELVSHTVATYPPNIDSGGEPFLPTNAGLWHGVTWIDPQPAPSGVFFNSQFDSGFSTIGYPWQAADEILHQPIGSVSERAGVSVFPVSSDTDTSSFYVFYTDIDRTPSEIWYRAGVYDLSSSNPINPDLFPIDLSAAAEMQLSGVAPPRTSGQSRAPSSDEQPMYPPCADNTVFVVWTDSRTGNGDIYFKRIDTCVDPVRPTGQAVPCGRSVDLSWDYPTCPLSPERLANGFDVYYATTSGGPYTLFSTAPLTATGETVTGLQPNTNYYFLIFVQDEAGNTNPANFDPSVQTTPPPQNEVMVRTSASCPMELSKTWVDDDGGQLLPGDTITGTITVTNGDSTSPLTGVEVRDDPELVLLVVTPLDGGIWEDADTILWQISGGLPGGGSAITHLTATVKCSVPDPLGGPDIPISDLASVCNDTYEAVSNETGRVTGTPPPCLTVNRPIVTISKAMTTATPTAGQPVAYTITVCNTGSAPETGVIIHDTIDTTWLDPLTLNAPGGTYMAGPPAYIEWTIPTLNPGLPCTTISYDIELEEAWANQRVCNFAEIFGTSGIYNSCGWDLPAGVQACFPSGGNQLLKNCCTMPCNVAATFGTGLPPYKPIPMPPPATPTNDTGVTDINNPLCFYQVQQSTTPKSVRIVKSTVADTMDIYY